MPLYKHNPLWEQVTWANLQPRVAEYKAQLQRDLELKICKEWPEYLEKWHKLASLRWLEDQAERLVNEIAQKKEK